MRLRFWGKEGIMSKYKKVILTAIHLICKMMSHIAAIWIIIEVIIDNPFNWDSVLLLAGSIVVGFLSYFTILLDEERIERKGGCHE